MPTALHRRSLFRIHRSAFIVLRSALLVPRSAFPVLRFIRGIRVIRDSAWPYRFCNSAMLILITS